MKQWVAQLGYRVTHFEQVVGLARLQVSVQARGEIKIIGFYYFVTFNTQTLSQALRRDGENYSIKR